MAQWLLWLLLVAGAVYLTVSSFVFSPVRMLLARAGLFMRYFVHCPMCQSFWLGMALWDFFPGCQQEALWLRIPVAGLAAVGVTFLVHTFAPYPSMFSVETGDSGNQQ